MIWCYHLSLLPFKLVSHLPSFISPLPVSDFVASLHFLLTLSPFLSSPFVFITAPGRRTTFTRSFPVQFSSLPRPSATQSFIHSHDVPHTHSRFCRSGSSVRCTGSCFTHAHANACTLLEYFTVLHQTDLGISVLRMPWLLVHQSPWIPFLLTLSVPTISTPSRSRPPPNPLTV